MIHWYINEAQADYVFKCLAQRPFFEVNALINDLHAQANPPKGPRPEQQVALKEQAWAIEQQKANGPIPEPPVWVDGPAPPAP